MHAIAAVLESLGERIKVIGAQVDKLRIAQQRPDSSVGTTGMDDPHEDISELFALLRQICDNKQLRNV